MELMTHIEQLRADSLYDAAWAEWVAGAPTDDDAEQRAAWCMLGGDLGRMTGHYREAESAYQQALASLEDCEDGCFAADASAGLAAVWRATTCHLHFRDMRPAKSTGPTC